MIVKSDSVIDFVLKKGDWISELFEHENSIKTKRQQKSKKEKFCQVEG